MKTTENLAFSCGTDFMYWQSYNCDICVKASHFNEKRNDFPPYRCVVQSDLEGQSVGLHEIRQRSYDAAQTLDCPYRRTERKKYKITKKEIKNQFTLKLE